MFYVPKITLTPAVVRVVVVTGGLQQEERRAPFSHYTHDLEKVCVRASFTLMLPF